MNGKGTIRNRRFQRRRSRLERIRRLHHRLQLLLDLADEAMTELTTTNKRRTR